MNLFPRKGGSEHYSPQAIMNGRGVTVEDLRIPFGSYMQVTNATLPHNSLEPPTGGAIALGMMGNESRWLRAYGARYRKADSMSACENYTDDYGGHCSG